MSLRFTVRPLFFLVLLTVVAVGCGPPLPPMATVKGKVTVDGQPVTSGQVTFIPTDAKNSAFGSAGPIDSNGEYTLSTAGHDGAPLGQYKVTVARTANMVPTPGATPMSQAPFGAQYQDSAKTPLTKEVVKDPEPGRYDLQLTK